MNKIVFYSPDVSRHESDEVGNVIASRWMASGPKVREFEQRVAQCSNCDRAVAFDSCTGAMEMTLRAIGVGPGDEVITTPYTYTATAEVIRNVGAKIVFVDLDGKSFEMDYEKLAEAITEKTKAVIPVDIGGLLCDYDTLRVAINSKASLFKPSNDIQAAIGRVAIVADAAHSFTSSRDGKLSGEFADFTCFSFQVLKPITTGGEGGAVVWKDISGISNDDLELTLRLLGDHGQTSRDKSKGWEYDIAIFGYNSIMTDVDAAMGLAQMDRLGLIQDKRTSITTRYDLLFDNSEYVRPLIQHIGPRHTSSMHLYPIRLMGNVRSEADRNKVYHRLAELGVPCNVHYKPLPMMTAYKKVGYCILEYPNAYSMFKNLLTIPYHTALSAEQQAYIADSIKEVVSKI